jgi:hypothetical protein
LHVTAQRQQAAEFRESCAEGPRQNLGRQAESKESAASEEASAQAAIIDRVAAAAAQIAPEA